MKPFLALNLALVVLAATACNNGDVTKNNTVPPIAGVVGGPDQGGGGGEIGFEIAAGDEDVVPLTPIVVKNVSRNEVEEVHAVIGDGGLAFAKIQGDVGDELEVSLEHPEEGHISRVFLVSSPKITEVRDPEGPETVIHAGVAAQIEGAGFCTAPACNTILFDGAPLEVVEEPRPGLLYFTVPAGALLGEHTVRVATAGTNGGDEDYVSAAFTVTLVAP